MSDGLGSGKDMVRRANEQNKEFRNLLACCGEELLARTKNIFKELDEGCEKHFDKKKEPCSECGDGAIGIYRGVCDEPGLQIPQLTPAECPKCGRVTIPPPDNTPGKVFFVPQEVCSECLDGKIMFWGQHQGSPRSFQIKCPKCGKGDIKAFTSH